MAIATLISTAVGLSLLPMLAVVVGGFVTMDAIMYAAFCLFLLVVGFVATR